MIEDEYQGFLLKNNIDHNKYLEYCIDLSIDNFNNKRGL
jgi:hypothetical protein